jgi:hypothetical protein
MRVSTRAGEVSLEGRRVIWRRAQDAPPLSRLLPFFVGLRLADRPHSAHGGRTPTMPNAHLIFPRSLWHRPKTDAGEAFAEIFPEELTRTRSSRRGAQDPTRRHLTLALNGAHKPSLKRHCARWNPASHGPTRRTTGHGRSLGATAFLRNSPFTYEFPKWAVQCPKIRSAWRDGPNPAQLFDIWRTGRRHLPGERQAGSEG